MCEARLKLLAIFDDFLTNTVNLNSTRIGLLEGGVDALKKFIRASGYEAKIQTFRRQGSWAHQTIIRPVDAGEYDADLLMFVHPNEGWESKDYVNKLFEVFAASGLYKNKVAVWDYCVTIEYAGDRKVDIAPCVVNRVWEGHEVCNRRSNLYEVSRPLEYTNWMIEQNGYSGGNSFRKVTRLLKYLRDIKGTFTCPSVLLTTLIGNQINWLDQGKTNYADVPTALLTLTTRLDSWLQDRPSRPKVLNPKLSTEDFGLLWSDVQYENFRKSIHRYREWIHDAFYCQGRDESIVAWQRIFGEDFGRGANVLAQKTQDAGALSLLETQLSSDAAHGIGLVDIVKRAGLAILPKWFFSPPYLKQPTWRAEANLIRTLNLTAEWRPGKDSADATPIYSGDAVQPSGGIWFDVFQQNGTPIPDGYRVEWRITNTGAAALAANAHRGDFYASMRQNRRWEPLKYRGVHMAEAFVVRMSDDVLVAQSEPFGVVIE